MELGVTKSMLAGGVLVLPVLAFITSFVFWPGALLKAYNWYWRRRLGLVVRYSHSGSYRFCYSSRGTPGGATPSMLLLHGFSATKDMWLPVVKHIPRNQHVVCVDMPGHEGTSRTCAEDYSIQGQVGRIHQFVQSIGLDKRPFHLVGTSMGGNVAGVYAACYPAHLSSVSLLCPAGLVYPTDSEFIIRLREMEKSQEEEEAIPLIPTTPQELENMLRLCCHTSLNLPRQVMRGLLDNRIPNNDFYREVFMEIVGEKSRHSLQENLPLITAPLQVIWGKEDQVLDVSGAAVLQAALPGCQVELLDNCGHSVALERPRKVANLIMDFLSAQEVTGEDAKKHS
ncbi:monoacylglycerol lipase ABHD6 [Seriola lalandi dorsalis]|uniref:monoacylglycerol lipase ABHD6 n=1 Tax=Seriola lalandi dorsalis TaxID=1841481 RepID=UPI000C6FCA43|nr:monoacylglycerol lipase ABHD6 [Seriola lalandi dorsalis]XP_023279937.1 monoacylglycerol lipase ABHD6 [Seriola lalandi dorsalis]XP_056219590.1 monoacylglycerol lipase abhd6-A-like [Seriola aureovittata]XP_056219599.1 monoacylglycerol lipase abhd6-A-like [Seriola aureovittata]XP_056219607.1 monoacylglycerol lipase abhd6-A-like [Seriola aureovittata]